MKSKNLNKKIRRLEARIAKDTKKLDKLRRKLAAGPKAPGKKDKAKKTATAKAPAQATQARRPRKKKKQKRNISPERRAQLAALMKERWAAKRAAASAGSDSGPPAELPS